MSRSAADKGVEAALLHASAALHRLLDTVRLRGILRARRCGQKGEVRASDGGVKRRSAASES
eukprot:scaffold7059_cov250-Pinguiococcus_pyrenoidosus.AAC.14